MPASSNSLPLYQTSARYFAACAPGVEPWAAIELNEVGADEIEEGYRGFNFRATPETLYRLLYTTRLFSRILAPLLQFECHSAKYLHRRVYDWPWESFMTPEQTLSVHAITANSALRHSRHTALVVKDAIVDRLRDQYGSRPNVDARNPDFAFHLFVNHNRAILYVDAAGTSLHRRGYRLDSVDAPIQETLAAAMVQASGWTPDQPFIDPFCGSGTLLAEAWMYAGHIPSGYLRSRFGLQNWPDFDTRLWESIINECNARIHLPDALLVQGSDIDPNAIQTARANCDRLPEGHRIQLTVANVQNLPGHDGAVICTNPPYGQRLSDHQQADKLLQTFGDILKQRFAGSRACVFFGDNDSVKSLGLKPKRKYAMQNGGLDGRCAVYDLFQGLARKRYVK